MVEASRWRFAPLRTACSFVEEQRLHSAFGDVPLAEFEAAYHVGMQAATPGCLESNQPSFDGT